MSNIGVGAERLSRVVGYNVSAGNKATTSANLPISIAILSQINQQNESGFDFTVPYTVTSAQQAGDLFGYGSPAHRIMSILRPQNGGVGGIPTIVYPIEKAVGSANNIKSITPTGTATGNVTHTIVIAGRRATDVRYDINIETGDTPADISAKIFDMVGSSLNVPVNATLDSPVTLCNLAAKWRGLSSAFELSVDTNGDAAGITYAVAQTTAASGTPSVTAALAMIGNRWDNMIINAIGSDSTTLSAFETWNGIPSQTAPTGRYTGIIMRPATVFTGSTLANPSSLTSARRNNCTIAISPAPNSKGFDFEAAANMVALYAPIAQSNPHIGAGGLNYPDMPVPSDGVIGVMSEYNERDAIVKLGCSTVDLVAGVYQIQDMVTTYRPIGDADPKFRFVRDLFVDWNIRYAYYLRELLYVVDKVITSDGAQVAVGNTITPKKWKQLLAALANEFERRALIARASYMIENTTVVVNSTNPNRLDTEFAYERTGVANISSTMAFANSYFGE
jgi:phage tail sheath gpL-like